MSTTSSCPRCGAHDRERHLLLYLQASGIAATLHQLSILHFAPERRLSPWIASHRPQRYVRCDLYPTRADIERVDMQAMPFADASFDLLLANHVLEHVADLDRSLTEIHRVLKPDGHAILQTPFSRKLHQTWEDPGIDNPQTRLQAHGQEDHVRLFGIDIFGLIESRGFESRAVAHADLLRKCNPTTHGVNPQEPLFLFQRKV